MTISPRSLCQSVRDVIAGLLISIGSFVGAGQWEDEDDE